MMIMQMHVLCAVIPHLRLSMFLRLLLVSTFLPPILMLTIYRLMMGDCIIVRTLLMIPTQFQVSFM